MKLIDKKITQRTSSSKAQRPISKNILSPRGVNLRSRRILYDEQVPFQSSDNEDQKDKPILPNTDSKTNRQGDESDRKPESKEQIVEEAGDSVSSLQQDDKADRGNFPSDESDDSVQMEGYQTPIKRKKRQCRPHPLKKIIDCDEFIEVQEIDFLTYFSILGRKKMFSTLLTNEFGQVIFADRLGSEHFQGSLNNFSRNPIYSMILEEDLDNFFDKVSWIEAEKRAYVKIIIYSKNSKRRYSTRPNDGQLTNQVMFNRYLKCLSCSITPVQITISQTDNFDGFWNKSLVTQNQPMKCYLFKARLTKRMPELLDFDLRKDKKIQKFLKYTQKKQSQKHQKQVFRRPEQFQFFHEKDEFDSIVNEYKQLNKFEKTGITGRHILNSDGGKSLSERERI